MKGHLGWDALKWNIQERLTVGHVFISKCCYGLNCVPLSPIPNSYVEAVTHKVIIFEDRVFKEVIKVN